MSRDKGQRFNEGKTRFDLIEAFAQLQKAKIFTKGGRKYGDHNWLKGMSWSKCYASALRHQQKWLMGEDFDIDPKCPQCKQSTEENWICVDHTGELHSALAAWNWDAITSYYKHYPQGDDRPHAYLKRLKIGLDIDEVICNWVDAWCKLYEFNTPSSWYFDGNIVARFDEMRKNGTLDTFYLGLEPKLTPSDIPFEPHCYVTARPVETPVTEAWLRQHSFPVRPVYTVPAGTSKVEVLKNAGVEIFVDDNFSNFQEINNAGICCFLYDAPHNQRYNVGHKRIKSLKELM